jgi:HD-GYP domain-containing protein (c-di-GMP phosphodiesterase class II)
VKSKQNKYISYPLGLKNDEICLEARIVAVADVVEAMHSHRPYRPGLGLEAALKEIQSHKSTRYDKTVVDACVNIFSKNKFSFKN